MWSISLLQQKHSHEHQWHINLCQTAWIVCQQGQSVTLPKKKVHLLVKKKGYYIGMWHFPFDTFAFWTILFTLLIQQFCNSIPMQHWVLWIQGFYCASIGTRAIEAAVSVVAMKYQIYKCALFWNCYIEPPDQVIAIVSDSLIPWSLFLMLGLFNFRHLRLSFDARKTYDLYYFTGPPV